VRALAVGNRRQLEEIVIRMVSIKKIIKLNWFITYYVAKMDQCKLYNCIGAGAND